MAMGTYKKSRIPPSERRVKDIHGGELINWAAAVRQKIRNAEYNHGLEESLVKFLARAMICESVSCAFCLTEEIPANFRFCPKVIPAQCHQCQEDIDDLDAEERASAAVK